MRRVLSQKPLKGPALVPRDYFNWNLLLRFFSLRISISNHAQEHELHRLSLVDQNNITTINSNFIADIYIQERLY